MTIDHVPVTAETVTDEQIQKLRGQDPSLATLCNAALASPREATRGERDAWRQRCADAINARAAKAVR